MLALDECLFVVIINIAGLVCILLLDMWSVQPCRMGRVVSMKSLQANIQMNYPSISNTEQRKV